MRYRYLESTVDDVEIRLVLKSLVSQCIKVSQQVAVLKRMRNILPFDIRKNINFTCHLLYHISITVHRPGISATRVRLKNREKVNKRAVGLFLEISTLHMKNF